jgi:hypothetical protein
VSLESYQTALWFYEQLLKDLNWCEANLNPSFVSALAN